MASAAMSEEDVHIYIHTAILSKEEEELTKMQEFGNRRQKYEAAPHKGKHTTTMKFAIQF
jgi:hypothetical protein